jgi:hypothetical protein
MIFFKIQKIKTEGKKNHGSLEKSRHMSLREPHIRSFWLLKKKKKQTTIYLFIKFKKIWFEN